MNNVLFFLAWMVYLAMLAILYFNIYRNRWNARSAKNFLFHTLLLVLLILPFPHLGSIVPIGFIILFSVLNGDPNFYALGIMVLICIAVSIVYIWRTQRRLHKDDR